MVKERYFAVNFGGEVRVVTRKVPRSPSPTLSQTRRRSLHFFYGGKCKVQGPGPGGREGATLPPPTFGFLLGWGVNSCLLELLKFSAFLVFRNEAGWEEIFKRRPDSQSWRCLPGCEIWGCCCGAPGRGAPSEPRGWMLCSPILDWLRAVPSYLMSPSYERPIRLGALQSKGSQVYVVAFI